MKKKSFNLISLFKFVAAVMVLCSMSAPCNVFAAVSNDSGAHPAQKESAQAPYVVRISPEDGDEDVALDAKIMAVFNKKMKDEDINEFTITLNDGVSDISTTVRYNSELMKVVITPLENLQPAHGYFVTISRTVRDQNGCGLLADKVWKFRTIKKADTNPPVIVDVSPTVSASSVPADSKIEVVFNKRMDESSINENTITLKRGREKIAGAIRYFPEVNKAVFSPITPLKPDSLFEVGISSEIRDASKIKLAAGQSYTFKTSRKIVAKNVPSSDNEEKEMAADARANAGSGKQKSLLKDEKIKSLISKVKSGKRANPDDSGLEDDIVAAEDDAPESGAKTEIVEMFPAPGAEMVNTDEKIIVKFNKKMNPATFNIFNFSVQDGEEYIFGKVELDPKASKATFTPAGTLKQNRKYKITVSEKIEDSKGARLGQNYYWEFSTIKQLAGASMKKMFDSPKAAGKDIVGPNVVAIMPRDNAESVPPETQVTATFDEPVKDFSLNSFTFRVLSGESEVPGRIYYDTTQKKAIFTPKSPLENGTAYNAQITTGIMDLSGNYMQREKRWKFIVGKNWSGRNPMITAVLPEREADEVDLSSPVSVTFDRKMKAASITPFTFFITDGTKSVQGKVTYDEKTNTATFNPWSTFSPNKTYNVTVAKTIEDCEGLQLSETQMWRIKTGSGLKSRLASGNVTSVAAGDDANMQIKVQKSMGSDLVSNMAVKDAAEAAAKTELGAEMNVNNPEKTNIKNLVPVADVKDRMSVSDKGAYGHVTAKSIKDTVDNSEIANDSAPDEMLKRYQTSDKSAYGQVQMKRIKDTTDVTDVTDDAMNETLKDQIAKFLSDDAKSQAKLGAQIDALPSNSDPVADASANGVTGLSEQKVAAVEEAHVEIPKAFNRTNADTSEKVRQDVVNNYNGKNMVYTKEDGINSSSEYKAPKAPILQMSAPPSDETSVYSDNPSKSAPARQPRLSGGEAEDLIKLEKAQKYGDEENPADSLVESPLREDRAAENIKPQAETIPAPQTAAAAQAVNDPAAESRRIGESQAPVQIAAQAVSQPVSPVEQPVPPAQPVRQQAPYMQAAPVTANSTSALNPGRPPAPKGMINGVPVEQLLNEGVLENVMETPVSEKTTLASADPGVNAGQAVPAMPQAQPAAKAQSSENTEKLKTHESEMTEDKLSDVGGIPMNDNDHAQFYVIAIFPNKNAKNVKADATITAVFNSNIDVASLNGNTFTVTGAEGKVNGKLLYNQRMKKLIFRPNGKLTSGVRYEVLLSSGIKRETGQALMPLKWSFTVK